MRRDMIQSTEHESAGCGASILVYGHAGMPSPTDSQSSDEWDQHAQGRGLNTVKADPDLARRQSRLTGSGSAMSAEYGP